MKTFISVAFVILFCLQLYFVHKYRTMLHASYAINTSLLELVEDLENVAGLCEDTTNRYKKLYDNCLDMKVKEVILQEPKDQI